MVLGPEALCEMEKTIHKIQQNIKTTQDWQKIYVDKKITQRDHVYLRVKPHKNTLNTDICAKLTPQFCGPFEVLNWVGPMAYQLALPSHVKIHNVFHISLLKKYVHDPSHVVDWNLI